MEMGLGSLVLKEAHTLSKMMEQMLECPFSSLWLVFCFDLFITFLASGVFGTLVCFDRVWLCGVDFHLKRGDMS